MLVEAAPVLIGVVYLASLGCGFGCGSRIGGEGGARLQFEFVIVSLLADQRQQRAIKIGDAFAMFGADGNGIAEAKAVAFQDAALCTIAFRLVDHQHDRHILFAQPSGDLLVERGQTSASVDHEHRGIGTFQRDLGLRAHPPRQAGGVVILPPGGIDRLEGQAQHACLAKAAVARDAGLVIDQRDALADEPVEQRRLADIGAADNDHLWSLGGALWATHDGVRVALCAAEGKRKLPAAGVFHAGPGFLRLKIPVGLQQFHADPVGALDEGHVPVARGPVDGNACVREALAGRVNVIHPVCEMAEIAPAVIAFGCAAIRGWPVPGQLDLGHALLPGSSKEDECEAALLAFHAAHFLEPEQVEEGDRCVGVGDADHRMKVADHGRPSGRIMPEICVLPERSTRTPKKQETPKARGPHRFRRGPPVFADARS